MAEDVVHDDERGHGVDYWDGAREDTRVVATGGGEFYGLFVAVYGVLLFCNSRNRLKRNAEVNGLPACNPAVSAAGVVFLCAYAAILTDMKRVVVFAPSHSDAPKSEPDVETFHGVDAHHRFPKVRRNFVEDRRAKACRNIFDDTLNDAADGIAGFANLVNEFNHFLRRLLVGAANDVLFDICRRNLLEVGVRFDVPYLVDVA